MANTDRRASDHPAEPRYEWDQEAGEDLPYCWTCDQPIHLTDDDARWEHSSAS